MAKTTLGTNGAGSTAESEGELRIDWARTLAEHDRWLRAAVLVRLGERQAVDEVMQEVALAAVAQRAPLIDPCRVGAWLYRIAIVQVLLYRRRRGRQRRLLGSYAGSGCCASEGSASPDALEFLLQDERDRLVREALERLPRRDAELLVLKYTEQWSYREMAAHLGVRESTVEARLHRARKRLREAMIATQAIEASK